MKKYLWIISMIAMFAACKKDETETPQPAAPVWNATVNFKVDNSALLFDTILYTNDAGNNYSVSRLQFYLSGFEFENQTGTTYMTDDVFYIDAITGTNTKLNFNNIPFGNYKRVKFYIGLDSANNITNALPNTVENQQMAWPDFMGGGYHFMKFEGSFLYNSSTWGFAMHLGKNQNLVTVELNNAFDVKSVSDTLNFTMNLNEWFRNPLVYDFNIDGNYSMNDDTAMSKLSLNGSDVFIVQ